MSDRKYRHRGYQDRDDDDRAKPSRPRGGPGPGLGRIEGGPRGRGAGIPAEAVFKCARCGTAQELEQIDENSLCTSCDSALHSCSNCAFFDTGRPFECRKPVDARIESKTKANQCDLFQPKMVRDLKPAQRKEEGSTPDPHDPRAAFNALFKK